MHRGLLCAVLAGTSDNHPTEGGGAPRAGLESYPRHVGARLCLVLPGTPAPPRPALLSR